MATEHSEGTEKIGSVFHKKQSKFRKFSRFCVLLGQKVAFFAAFLHVFGCFCALFRGLLADLQ
jgi:hypothetical protein